MYAVHLYDPANYVNILKATVQVQESMESDPKIGLFVSFNPTFVAVGLLYADASAEVPAAFKSFRGRTGPSSHWWEASSSMHLAPGRPRVRAQKSQLIVVLGLHLTYQPT
jgi:hypothetical protein